MKLITSRNNPKIKAVRALRQRKFLRVEGIFPVGEAVAAGIPIDALYYAPDLLSSEFARQLLADQAAAGIPCYATTPEVFKTIADRENPQGLLAIARSQLAGLQTFAPDNFPWGVALVAPQDPGNIGAIMRTIDAVGASGLILLDNSADPYHPSAVRASMGALFWHPVVHASYACLWDFCPGDT